MFGNSMMMGGAVDSPAPEYVGNGGLNTFSGSTITVPFPLGIQAGDLLLAVANFASDLTNTAGFTRYGFSIGGGVGVDGLYKIADGSETGNATFTYAYNATGFRICIACVRNWQAHNAVAGTLDTFPSVSTDNNNSLVVYMAYCDGDTNAQPVASFTNSALDEVTVRLNQRTSSQSGGGAFIASGVDAISGFVNLPTYTKGTNPAGIFPFAIVISP